MGKSAAAARPAIHCAENEGAGRPTTAACTSSNASCTRSRAWATRISGAFSSSRRASWFLRETRSR
jgi:hypothetical protein